MAVKAAMQMQAQMPLVSSSNQRGGHPVALVLDLYAGTNFSQCPSQSFVSATIDKGKACQA
jgi:hypothetical protein